MSSATNFVILGIVSLTAFTGCLGDSKSYCDNREWFEYRGHCYSFQSGSDKRLSYYDAEDYCRSQGAHLVSFHSQAESDYVNELVESRYGGRRWIGLNILHGKPEWSDNGTVDYLNVYNKTQYKKESCFILWNKGSFRPEHCELRYYPICKRPSNVEPVAIPPLPPSVLPGNCPQDWLQFDQKCYKFFGKEPSLRKKFKDAKLACLALGEQHDLASIHSQEHQAFLTQKLGQFGSSVWIGLSHVESDEIGQILVFGWTDNSRTDFNHWRTGHPLPGTWKNCARLQFEGVGKGEWISDYCDINAQGYICERPPDVSLPPQRPDPSVCGDGTEYNGVCYKLHSTPKTWDQAEETCRENGGHLASVTDGFEQEFLLGHPKKNNVETAWIGLRSVKDSGILRWSDNRPLYYTNFEKLPYPSAGKEVCTFITVSKRLQWTTGDCQTLRPFVCKSSNETLPTPKDVIGVCPSNLPIIDVGDNNCYHIGEAKDDRLQWGGLYRYCIRRGMEMITLHSDHQANSLMAYLYQRPYNYWLGFIKTLDRQSFMWVDQSKGNYTNWKEREPDLHNDRECASVSTTDSKWTTEDCNTWAGTICRVKKTGIA